MDRWNDYSVTNTSTLAVCVSEFLKAEMLQDPILVGLENDQHFLRCILKTTEIDGELEVTSSEASPCCNVGDHYMSSMTRVKVAGRNKAGKAFKRCFLMKRQPANVFRREAFRCDPAFRNEAVSYETIVPAMEKFAEEPMPFVDCIHASSQLIVLEDLQPLGFKMADRLKGLDKAHALLAMNALGKFHGTSLAMKFAGAEKFDRIRNLTSEVAFAPESEPIFGASVENALKMALMALDESCGSNYTRELGEAVHILKMLRGTVFKRLRVLTQPNEPLAVLCHGDLWLNNLMFRYEGEDPVEVRFVDLQVMRYSSLATDILYFLSTSIDPAVLNFYQDDLIEAYHDMLTQTLNQLAPQAPRISCDQINDQIEELALFGLLMGFLLLPAITSEGRPIDLDVFKKEGDIFRKFAEQSEDVITDKYSARVRSLVLHFISRGYI